MSPLARLLDEAARGRLPPADGAVEVFPAPSGAAAAVLSFTAHLVVAADVDPAALHAVAPRHAFEAWTSVANWLASQLGVARGTGGDVMLATIAGDRVPAVPVTQVDAYEHPRVARASRYRRDVQVYVTDDEAGVLTIGRGIADRYEIAFEVERRARESGLGRALVSTAIALVPTGEAVWAQVHPANAASLRTVLAAGFLPIGYEQLIDGGR